RSLEGPAMTAPSLVRRRLLGVLGVLAVTALALGREEAPRAAEAPPAPTPPAKVIIDFNRQILPILSENCFACHGPDEKQRKAKFRLDTKEGAFAELESGNHAIVPGKPAESEIIVRIASKDRTEHMPPPTSGKKLTPQQVELLRQWIDQGAPWSGHWAFVAPRRPPLPPVKDAAWPRNPIDHFILARLEAEGLRPSSEPDPT